MKTFAARSLLVLLIALMLAACGSSRVVKREGSAPAPAAQRSVQAAPASGSGVCVMGAFF